MRTVGIIGTGRMGLRLAAELAGHGHRVILGSRDPLRAARIAAAISPNARGGSYEDATQAEIAIPAMFLRDGALAQLAALPALRGKILIDISNPFNDDYSDFTLPWGHSASEQIRLALPQSRVVAAFKNIYWEIFDRPRFEQGYSDIFVMSDDEGAKREVLDLFQQSPFRFVDAGALANARTVERMTLLAQDIGRRYGYLPRIGWKLLGEPWKAGACGRHLDAFIR